MAARSEKEPFAEKFDRANNKLSIIIPTSLAVVGAVSIPTAVIMWAGDRFILNPLEKKGIQKITAIGKPKQKAA